MEPGIILKTWCDTPRDVAPNTSGETRGPGTKIIKKPLQDRQLEPKEAKKLGNWRTPK
jgi:hypothetical protein